MRVLLPLLLAAAAQAAAGQGEKGESSLIGSVVRSEKWDIKRGEHKLEEFTGNVTYRREGRRLRADWALYDHDSQLLEVKGGIRAEDLLEDGTTAVVEGERASFDKAKGFGQLAGRSAEDAVRLLLLEPDGAESGRGRARRVVWDIKGGTFSLEGDAWFREKRGEVWADTARFLRGTRRLELLGRRPVLSAVGPGWAAAVQADSLSATALDRGRRRVVGQGRAHGWLHFPVKGGLQP